MQLSFDSSLQLHEIGAPDANLSVDAITRIAIDSIKKRIYLGEILACAVSGGKDSGVVANLTLTAAREYAEETAKRPKVYFLHGDTLTENPEVKRLARSELEKMRLYGERHAVDIEVIISSPSLPKNYFLMILAGRSIANLPDGGSNCSMDLKLDPNKRTQKRLAKIHGEALVTLLGTRASESNARAANMKKRGESAITPAINKQGTLILSPIMNWSLDNVFEYIAYCKNGLYESYTDFVNLLELYRSANSGACELAAYTDGNAPKTGCSSRFGCWHCQKAPADNESLDNMIKEDSYKYMSGLAALRKYITATHYNPNKRNWLGRKLNDDGTLTIAPVAYSPEHCKSLTAYCLTIDAVENMRARELGIEPRFQILSMADCVAIDFYQARYGYGENLTACILYDKVHHKGERYSIPEVTAYYPKSKFPQGRRVPFADSEFYKPEHGLRDIEAETAGAENLIVKKDGSIFSGGEGYSEFKVDEEGAELFFGFEFDRAVAKFARSDVAPSAVMHYFIRLGTVQIYKGQHTVIDRMVRMSNQIHRHNIRSILNDPVSIVEALT